MCSSRISQLLRDDYLIIPVRYRGHPVSGNMIDPFVAATIVQLTSEQIS